MESPIQVSMRNAEPTDPIKEAKRVVARLVRQNKGDIKAAYNKFSEGANERLDQGRAPNEFYGGVVDVFSKIVPIQEALDKIKTAQEVTKNPILNNLIYESVMQINELLMDDVIEPPETEGYSPGEEIRQYEQALIEIYNKLPEAKNEKRKDLLEVSSFISSLINTTKSGVG